MSLIDTTLLVPEHITCRDLADNYPALTLSNKHGTATIALHGAHVTDYTPAGQKPVLFTSKSAIYKEGKAIRGGVPICWPWFNAHPTDDTLPSHGYARAQFWALIGSSHSNDSTSVTLEFSIENLRAEVTITLSQKLDIALTSTNISNESQIVGGALHTYFQVSNISSTTLSGLDNVSFINTVGGANTSEKQSGDITITEEIDRIYENTGATVHIFDAAWNRDIAVQKSGSLSTVVWNPWIEKSKGMADLGNKDYHHFVCIEAANAREDVYQLTPGETHTLSTSITSLPRA